MHQPFSHKKAFWRFIKIKGRRKGGKEVEKKRVKERNEEKQKEKCGR